MNDLRTRAIMRSSALGVAAWLWSAAALAGPVHVAVDQGGAVEYGAGYTVSANGNCFVVTPYHVVETAQQDEITVTDTNGVRAKAGVFKESPEHDAALLKVADPGTMDCPPDWSDGIAALQVSGGAQWLTARKVNGSGGMRQTRWFIASSSPDELVLEPYSERDRLQEGDSGSVVYAGEQLLGMVVEVSTRDKSIRVRPQTRLFALFNGDMTSGRSLSVLLQPVAYRNQFDPYATTAAREFFDRRTPLAVRELAVAPNVRPATTLPAATSLPEGIDYFVIGEILSLAATREANPNYVAPAQRKKKKGNFGEQMLKSLGSSLSGKNENVQYFYVYNVDVQVQVMDVARNSSARNLERQAFKLAADGTTPQELEKSARQLAVARALELTFRKYGLPLSGS